MGRVRLGSFVAVAGAVVLVSLGARRRRPPRRPISARCLRERAARADRPLRHEAGRDRRQTHLSTPGGGADASWSPDGRQRIAFGADPEGDGNVDIFVMNVDGSALRQLTTSPGLDIWPDWLRGGQQIVFASTGPAPRTSTS